MSAPEPNAEDSQDTPQPLEYGVVKSVNKGSWGFIASSTRRRDIFWHESQLADGLSSSKLTPGLPVQFYVQSEPGTGKLKALSISPAAADAPTSHEEVSQEATLGMALSWPGGGNGGTGIIRFLVPGTGQPAHVTFTANDILQGDQPAAGLSNTTHGSAVPATTQDPPATTQLPCWVTFHLATDRRSADTSTHAAGSAGTQGAPKAGARAGQRAVRVERLEEGQVPLLPAQMQKDHLVLQLLQTAVEEASNCTIRQESS